MHKEKNIGYLSFRESFLIKKKKPWRIYTSIVAKSILETWKYFLFHLNELGNLEPYRLSFWSLFARFPQHFIFPYFFHIFLAYINLFPHFHSEKRCKISYHPFSTVRIILHSSSVQCLFLLSYLLPCLLLLDPSTALFHPVTPHALLYFVITTHLLFTNLDRRGYFISSTPCTFALLPLLESDITIGSNFV